MTVRYMASAMLVSVLVLTSPFFVPYVWAQSGEITSVQVAPDISSITIHNQGALGRHSAFVLDGPYRLVIDFDSATIGTTKNRIKVDRPPIKEIRLGYHNNRARVVVDFGENPVPAYRIERNGDMVIISLGKTADLPRGQMPPRVLSAPKNQVTKRPDRTTPPEASKSKAQPAVEPTGPTPPSPVNTPQVSESESGDKDDSQIVVKNAGIKGNLVYVEMMDKHDPRISYRLIVDLDLEGLKMHGASLSDAKGNIRKFHVTRIDTEKLSNASSGGRFASGPKRYWPSRVTASAPNLNEANVGTSAEHGQIATKIPQAGWPLKIEAFQPQLKSVAR